jgi:ElaB/YqjD/DUF883 family membrane-anchored ribosome-binding protein
MESSRDSSVWRNLAVTFGGGLALGAVGMKLTQTALRPVEAPAAPESNPLTDRLSSMERRLSQVEQVPAPPRPAAPQPAPAAIDQKVLEAVIAAVDARLHEHAGQMDRRLADLEARLAIMQGLQDQDRKAAEQVRNEATALRSGLNRDMRQVLDSVSQVVAGQTATATELHTLRQQHERVLDAAEQRFADMQQEYRQGISELRSEMEQSIEARLVTSVAAAAVAQLEEQLAPLRSEVQHKEQELTELRQRLADSEKSVLDVVLAIGDVCRQAAERIGGAHELRAAAPAVPAPAPPKAEALADPVAPAEGSPIAAPPAPIKTEPVPAAPAATLPSRIQPVPDFLPESTHRTNWRIPLVSSFLVSTGYLVLMHYLAAPLQ